MSSLRLPPSLALEAFLQSPSYSFIDHGRSGIAKAINIHVLDVIPIELETVIVSVDRRGFQKLVHEVKEHDGTNGKSESSGEDAMLRIRGQLDAAVRNALSLPRIIHQGDVLALPKSPQGNTSLVAVINHSEPVLQGLITPQTKVVVTLSSKISKQSLANGTIHRNGTVDNFSD